MTVIIALVLGALAVWLTRKALSAPVYSSVVAGGQSESRDVDIEKADETAQISETAQITHPDIFVDVSSAMVAPVVEVAAPKKVTKPAAKRTAKKSPKTSVKSTKKPAKKQTKVTKRK